VEETELREIPRVDEKELVVLENEEVVVDVKVVVDAVVVAVLVVVVVVVVTGRG
jgi:hypothetical protein